MTGQTATVASYANVVEAELAVAVLKAAGVPSYIRTNDSVGIFGPGFQGGTARGVDVIVPRELLGKARRALDHDTEE